MLSSSMCEGCLSKTLPILLIREIGGLEATSGMSGNTLWVNIHKYDRAILLGDVKGDAPKSQCAYRIDDISVGLRNCNHTNLSHFASSVDVRPRSDHGMVPHAPRECSSDPLVSLGVTGGI